ncbi:MULTISPECIES: hypothetical protein [Sphingomonas]|jgi:hypothetical protein|uniref:Uncharacterized protein n=1 Tax=Sphingomonas paucimobilis TaxID=13689 RepID=A0A411LJJ0_SPHPI|nr:MULTISPECIES: hypothetical protein [Sphingomonas]MBQ1479080.1 hypothetical protein [Sphingomonas sp.]MCM3678571.1 hypothetical protein [Sphingomonas paucimobilis]MDG5969599.1 hypothetical protein [Sphingomonas paucimobilis]NNG59513.1 hypothetical protein [Sphingomonas paucimobilis]QBE92504.1 hypothetical protein DRN02_011100 [Sphingomonas paucimobilis]
MRAGRWVRDIRVYCPVAPATLAALLTGKPDAIERDQTAAALLAILRTPPLGDFGRYREVVELAIGYEGFRPGEGAVPTLGAVGEASWSPTVILTALYDAEADVSALTDQLLAAHPWDVPVIAVSEPYRLLVRG